MSLINVFLLLVLGELIGLFIIKGYRYVTHAYGRFKVSDVDFDDETCSIYIKIDSGQRIGRKKYILLIRDDDLEYPQN